MNRIILFLPLIVFVVIGIFLVKQLGNDQTVLPTVLLDKSVPHFELAEMPGLEPFTYDSLKGEVSLVNVFGSWCPGCNLEHPQLVEIHKSGIVPIHGINWADTPERGLEWLMRHGNAYTSVGNDEAGRAVVSFGVSGAPETFVIDAQGRIRYRHAGPIDKVVWEKTLLPLVRELQQQAASDS